MTKKPKTDPKSSKPTADGDPIEVNAQFIRDLSFEAPNMPETIRKMQETLPDIKINVNVNSKQFEETVFEISLIIEARATVGEEVGFILELEYCGVFTLNCAPEAIKPIALIECPRLLFPFARSILAQVTREAGFPPLMLGTVDFPKMFKEELEKYQEGAK